MTADLVARMRSLERTHEHDGWPGVQMHEAGMSTAQVERWQQRNAEFLQRSTAALGIDSAGPTEPVAPEIPGAGTDTAAAPLDAIHGPAIAGAEPESRP